MTLLCEGRDLQVQASSGCPMQVHVQSWLPRVAALEVSTFLKAYRLSLSSPALLVRAESKIS